MSSEEVSNKLSEIDLSGVAFSAAVALDPTQPDGKLGPVGAPYEKLRAAAQSSGVARIHTVVLSDGNKQDVLKAGLTETTEAPNIYRDPNADFRVILAKTVGEAIELLYQHVGPRGRIRRHEIEDTEELPVLKRRVSIELYKELPLMRRIEPEELPRESSGPDDAESSFGRQRKKPTLLNRRKIRRWEERIQRQTAERNEPVKLQAAFNDFRRVAPRAASDVPRFVVTGPPGSGKTTLGQYVARKMATGAWSIGGRTLIPYRVSLRAWQRWATKNEDNVLAHFLTHRCYGDPPLFKTSRLNQSDARQLWRDWLRRGDVLLLLDGLDELTGNDPYFNKAVEDALSNGDLQHCPVMLTCRTLSLGQHKALCGKMPVFKLEGLRPEQQDDYILQFPAEHKQHFDPQALIDQLNASPAMRELAANPLLLSIICFVVDDPLGVRLPATRADLYDRAIDKLLARPDRPSKSGSLPLARIRGLLEYAALVLFSDPKSENRLTFDQQSVLNALDAATKAPATHYNDPAVSDKALTCATECGLLRGGFDSEYEFLHPTIQEFLVASALARIINKPTGGWNTKLPIGGSSYSITEVIDHKAWDPNWHEVVLLLAGQLDDPTPLLKMLRQKKSTKTNPHGDDHFRHRLALAAECLPQIPEERRFKQFEKLRDKITTKLFSLWWHYRDMRTEDAIENISEALPALATVNGLVVNTPILERVLRLMCGANYCVRMRAVNAIATMGSTARRDDILVLLVELLQISGENLCRIVAQAIGNLGITAAQSNILDLLHEMLHDEKYHVRWAASLAIGELGGAAARIDIIDRLLTLMRDDSTVVRMEAIEALGKIGGVATRDYILDRLLELLHVESHRVRLDACETISKLGSAAARPDVLDYLLELMLDHDADMRDAAGKTIAELGSAAAQPDILDSMLELLHNKDSSTRWTAAIAVGGLGVTAARGDILDRLLELLCDVDSYVRSSAARAIGKLDSVAQRPYILTELCHFLYDENSNVRRSAAEAIESLGSAAAHPCILDGLFELLHAEDSHMHTPAIRAIAALGSKAAIPSIVSRLLELLYEEESSMRHLVATAIGKLGIAAKNTDILKVLLERLFKNQDRADWNIIVAIGKLGRISARDYILKGMLAWIDVWDSNELKGWFHSELLDNMEDLYSAGARPPIVDALLASRLEKPSDWPDDDPEAPVFDPFTWSTMRIATLGTAASWNDIVETIMRPCDHSSKEMGVHSAMIFDEYFLPHPHISFPEELRIFHYTRSGWRTESIAKLAALGTAPAA